MRTIAYLAAALVAIGCGSATGAAPAVHDRPREPAPPPTAGPPQLAEGVVAMEPTCAEGRDEACDALDSDCDGRIDEGCEGAVSGAMNVAVAWNGDADVDLVVEGPGVSDLHAVSGDGACGEALERIERRTFERAAPGSYSIALRVVDACGGEGPVTASVTVAVGGRVLGTFNRAVPPEGTVEVVAIDVE